VLNEALPPATVPVPRTVAPSLNVTGPDGDAGELDVTVAVKVTDCPEFDGLTLETSDVVVEYLLTTWLTVLDVLPLKLPSPR